MASLYRLNNAYTQLQQMIEEGQEGLEDTLASITDAVEEKLEAYAMVIKNIESDVEGIKSEEKRLAERRRVMENGIKRMKDAMHQAMTSTGERKIKGEKFTFTIQKNPPVLKVVDESLIPKEFFVEVEPTIDRKSLMARLKAQEVIPGAEISQDESLRIR